MVTRSKSRIFKPKCFIVTKHPLPSILFAFFNEPQSVSQALDDTKWKKAMTIEYTALMHNNTWVLVSYVPDNILVVGNKWVFKKKYKADGLVERLKARLVAKGFHQTYGIYFFETFGLVVKPTTIRVVLTLALSNKWPMRRFDF